MSTKRIFLIHATSLSLSPINEAFARLWPEAQVCNLLEDSLSVDVAAAGVITPAMIQRFVDLSLYAQKAEADGILFTCSAFGEAIARCKHELQIPVLKPNEAMIEEALQQASRIALLATFEPTIRSMGNEFHACAQELGKNVEIVSHSCPEAFKALQAGDVDGHDRLIAESAARVRTCDVLCFAQFSMVTALAKTKAITSLPVLTTPDSAVLKLRKILEV